MIIDIRDDGTTVVTFESVEEHQAVIAGLDDDRNHPARAALYSGLQRGRAAHGSPAETDLWERLNREPTSPHRYQSGALLSDDTPVCIICDQRRAASIHRQAATVRREDAPQPELDLLDLVQQYGLRRAGEVAARGEVAAGLRAAYEALFARIEAEVQRLRTAVIDAGILVDRYVDQRDRALAEVERLKVAGPGRTEQARNSEGTPMWQHECTAISAYPKRPTVDRQCSFCPAIGEGPWRPLLVAAPRQYDEEHFGCKVASDGFTCSVAAPLHRGRYHGGLPPAPQKEDPLVLSLPEVPEGARALVGVSSGATYPKDGMGWAFSQSETGAIGLGELLDREGSVTVEMAPPREPRTWSKISSTEGLPAVVDVKGQGRWKRSPGTDVYVHETEQQGFYSLADLREFGDVTEVIE